MGCGSGHIEGVSEYGGCWGSLCNNILYLVKGCDTIVEEHDGSYGW